MQSEIVNLPLAKTNNIYAYFIGYYYYIIFNENLMKKYYNISIDNGNLLAMNDLGYYYQYINYNYDLMKKYYLMAIEKR